MPVYFQKPENALKRAIEFIEVDKKEAALDVLNDVIKSKKHRNWQKIHEPILKQYLSLCVELRKSVNAKEGLYQYRGICQQMNVASLEEIFRYFLQLSESTAEQARQQSREQVTVDDLDQVQTPEGILLSSVSAEDTQDRTDRIMLTPWVKFLWEAYRNVLDLLRNNNRVERLYQETAQQAFRFCVKYNRRTEFKKLCGNIRNHLSQIMKYQNQVTAIDLDNPESLQMHLELRLFQLDSAITMELWQEAFKSVEDIHQLMQWSRKPAKPQMLANYFQKLALVFWKAKNYYFHAATLHCQYVLFREQKKSISQEELQKLSSKVWLATLAVPIAPGQSAMEDYLNYDETSHDKGRHLASLLGLTSIPTRNSLIRNMLKISSEKYVLPEIVALHSMLEVDFQPLKLCKKVDETFQFLNTLNDSELVQYVEPLKSVALTRMLKQVSEVYDSMTFKKLTCLVPFLNEHELERLMVDGVKQGDLQLTIDHRQGIIKFGTVVGVAMKENVPEGPSVQELPSEQMRNQLMSMSRGFLKAVTIMFPQKLQKERLVEREQLVQQYLRQERKEHGHILNRRAVIETRKENIENMRNEIERKEQAKIKQQINKLRAAEQKRLEEERERRKEERKQQEFKEIQKKLIYDRVASLRETDLGRRAFKDVTEEEIEKMDPDDILARQVEQLEQEKREFSVKLRTQEKKVDHLARAMRKEEIPLLEAEYEHDKVELKELWEQEEEEKIERQVAEHKYGLATKDRLSRMNSDKDEFLSNLNQQRLLDYKDRYEKFQLRLNEVKEDRLAKRRLQRIEERKQNFIKEKEEARRKREEEKLRKEREEEEKKQAELRAAREKELEEIRAKNAEIERKQQEKLREVEEKQRRRMEELRGAERDRGNWGETGGRTSEESSWRRGDADNGGRDQRDGERAPAQSSGKYMAPSRRAHGDDGQAPMRRDDDRDRWQDDRGFGSRDRGFGDRRERGFGDRGDRDRGFGDRGDRGFGDRGDRDRGFGDRGDRDRGLGDRGDRDRGLGDRGDRDRGFGDRGDRGFGDRDRDRGRYRDGGDRSGFGDRGGRGFGDRDRDRGFSDRGRDRGFGDRGDRGGFGGRDRGYEERSSGGGYHDSGPSSDRSLGGSNWRDNAGGDDSTGGETQSRSWKNRERPRRPQDGGDEGGWRTQR